MFGLFKPTCPCDPEAKRWLEERLQWLTRQFGMHILLERSIVLPTDAFFPDAYDGTPESVEAMFRRVCEYMDVDEDRVEMELFNDRPRGTMSPLDPQGGSFAAGTWEGGEWEKGVVRIERSMLDRPADLVGTMAHELAHQRLLGEGRADSAAFDNELLTDLTAAFFGFGVFLANNPRKSTGALHYWPGTKLRRPEYLSEPMLAYALAHIAWWRDEPRAAWIKALRWAPWAAFKQGLRFLDKTNDSLFLPVRCRGGRDEE